MTNTTITTTTRVSAVVTITTIRKSYPGCRINIDGHYVYLPSEVVAYIHKAIDNSGITLQVVGRRLCDKANPLLHYSNFDRESLREFCRRAAGRHHFHHIKWDLEYTMIGYWAAKVYAATK